MQDITVYDVVITGTDESDIESSLLVNVEDPNAQDTSGDGSTSDDDSGSSETSALPSVSLLATISMVLAGAALIRRDEE